ncbi:alpha-L-arabinofuranosidase C-terminal domain-containing protein [Oceanispirochaeta sp.]|jgi:alpha-N-arabinofuranosidase|uniref:alpha-N-arabinofuranosidase n=1 Tax=Oceanispirochaeta sp. TaxID=2035350 RepID=UPI00260B41B9|nr:alpha-L-arabinofuranosidase C-terminal domain-containing protein [Oceanispirochaeta sp.]MDA3957104.1 alpha-N-arabinofuranosidase [Oceanispirochaeta sp.]
MKQHHLHTSIHFVTGSIAPRLFGSFVEHMGSVIYNGIYEPDHPQADEKGFRKDVLALIQDLKLSVIRYPGGNFSSGYNWEDTVGPKKERPVLKELAWEGIETNQFGLNEFLEWVKLTGAEPIITINLGTRGIDAARNLVEYCNGSGGTYWSDLRRSHGYGEPHGIKLWCLGNELDGEWQIAAKRARDYGALAREAAKVMRKVDPSIQLVTVGSSARHLDSYPEWDRKVLDESYEQADYISLHNYINKKSDNTPTYLARPIEMEKQICEIIAACDYVQGAKRSQKTMYLAFDEWNVHKEPDIPYEKWQIGSPFDWCQYTMEDTLVFASMMLTILRHADRIKIGCQSLLVNTIPLILSLKEGPAWRNATYYPLLHASLYAKGEVLQQQSSGPLYTAGDFTDVPGVDSATVLDEEGGVITLFSVNRLSEDVSLKFICDGMFQGEKKEIQVEHIQLYHKDLMARNTIDAPETLTPVSCSFTKASDEDLSMTLRPYSWNVFRMKQENKE